MTDATPPEGGYTVGAESSREANSDPDGTSGNGVTAGEEKTVAPESGAAGAWTAWPGVARPAGWFLSAAVSGEAAPPERPGTEPARADAAQSAPRPPMAGQAGGPEPGAAQPADRPGRSSAADWADGDDERESAEGRAGAGVADGGGADGGRSDGVATGPDEGAGSYETPNPAPGGGPRLVADPRPGGGPAEVPGQEKAARSYRVADSGVRGGWYEDPQPTTVHRIPQLRSWRSQPEAGSRPMEAPPAPPLPGPWPGQVTGMPPVPVVGPTAALRGRAGGPGFTVPPGAVFGLYDPAHRSGWQLAEAVWSESGIGWEPPTAEPLPAQDWSGYPRGGLPGQSPQAGYWPDGGRQGDYQAGGGRVEYPAADRQDSGYRADGYQDDGYRAGGWQDGDSPASGRQGDHPADGWQGDDPAGDWQDDDSVADGWQRDQPAGDWQRDQPAGDWQDDQPAGDSPADGWRGDYPDADWRDGDWQDGDWQDGDHRGGRWEGDYQADDYQDGDYAAGGGRQAELPLGAPTYAGAPPAPAFARAPAFTPAPAPAPASAGGRGPARSAAPTLPDRWQASELSRGSAESDELYQAWQGSVRQAAARPRMTAARRRQAWHVARVGVPAAVLVTVGAGAVMMLTGKTNNMLASSASQGSPASGAGDSAAAFAGYAGQRGTVTVNSIATAGGTSLAVGSADGHPAIWRRAGDGSWTLVSASSPLLAQRPGVQSLTSVAYGPRGWIAVGDVLSGATQQPVVLTSSDGVAWQAVTGAAFTAPGTYVMAVTASQNGYVVVGKQVMGGRTYAALWWSADLRTWVPGSNGGLDGRLASSAVYAVAATTTWFIAAGTHGSAHTIWTSANGRNWAYFDVPMPPGATSALLSQVSVNGTSVVAAGYATGKAGNVPVVVVSTDGGAQWRQILLNAPGGLGSITALTAAGSGFVAAGQAGPAGARHAVTWSSPDGLTWSAATPVSAGQITALTAAGGTVSGAVQGGAGPSVVTLTAP